MPVLRCTSSMSALLAFLALSACGDDGKTTGASGPQPTPGATAPLPAPSPSPAPAGPSTGPSIPKADCPTATAGVRVGDWVTWDVSVAGVPGKTSLTWRALEIACEEVRIRVESTTTDAAGKVVASTATENWVPAPQRPRPAPLPVGVARRTVTVAGRKIVTSAPAAGTERTGIAYADDVPLGGVAWSAGAGGVEQTVVGFGRGS